MGWKKIGEAPSPAGPWRKPDVHPCTHPEHDPPMQIVLPPGIYEHVCPHCGQKTVITVPLTYT